MTVLCKKSSLDFTAKKAYKIICYLNRGMISIKNDLSNTHIILNSNRTNHVPREFFDKYFVMTKELEKMYSGVMG